MSSGSDANAHAENYRSGCYGFAVLSLVLIVGVLIVWLWRDSRLSLARTAANEMLNTQKTAWNAGDLAAFMATYRMHDATTLYDETAKLHRGWDAINDRFRKLYGHRAVGQLEYEEVVTEVLATDTVVLHGRWVLTTNGVRTAGLFTMTLRQFSAPEGWKIVHDHVTIGVRN